MKEKKLRWKTREEWEWCRLEYKAPIRPGGRKLQLTRKSVLNELKIVSIDEFYAVISKQAEDARVIMNNMRDNSTEWD